MSWATHAIEGLQAGKTVQIRPHGNSMNGKINSGDLVTISPCTPEVLKPDDIVLVKVKGNVYVHLIKAVDGERYQIGNNKGGINGWVGTHAIYGKVVRVEP